MIEVGVISAKILSLLEKSKKPKSIGDLRAASKESKENTCMAIGWLVRGGLAKVSYEKEKYVVTLILKGSI